MRRVLIETDDNDQWPDWVYAASRHMVDEGALRFRLLVGPVLDTLALAQPVDDEWEYRVVDKDGQAQGTPLAEAVWRLAELLNDSDDLRVARFRPYRVERRRVGVWEPVERTSE